MNHNSPYSIYRYLRMSRELRREMRGANMNIATTSAGSLVDDTATDDLATSLALDLPVKETTGDANREPDHSGQHTYLRKYNHVSGMERRVE